MLSEVSSDMGWNFSFHMDNIKICCGACDISCKL